MKRNLALFVAFGAGQFGSAQPTRNADLDTKGTEIHGELNRALQGTAERNTTFQLDGDVFRNQLSGDIRILDFPDLNINFLAGFFCNFLIEYFVVLAFPTNDNARTRGEHGYAGAIGVALNDDLRNGGIL